jgi:hypothetical protein
MNLLFLVDFPFAHTDEPWLSGLTRQMMSEKRLDVTEPFFDLYPRHPHALKILFHLLQMPFILIGGYSLFSVRLLSLGIAVVCLYWFYRLLLRMGQVKDKNTALLITCLLSTDIQFIYASHTARQEILLVLILILALYYYQGIHKTYQAFLSGLMIGLSFGIHPNAFILSVPLGMLFLLDIMAKRKSFSMGLYSLLGLMAGGVFFALLSLLFNPGFIQDYLAYGSPLGVTRSPDTKFRQLPLFLKQLFLRIGGTYYLPDIRVQMIIFPLFLVLTGLVKKNRNIILTTTAGLLMGIAILGKYSPLSIVFLFPLLYLSIFTVLKDQGPRLISRIGFLLLLLNIFVTSSNIRDEISPSETRESYEEYQTILQKQIPPDGVVLAGLNAEFSLEAGHLFDFRNLSYLPAEKEKSLENYLKERQIEYILYPEELDFIYENRPVWNVLYGNPGKWYPQLQNFIKDHTVLMKTVNSPGYAMRIQAYKYTRMWTLKIYRVLPEAASEE